jgi:glycosyltransferase involved in cell wall biosynthesis
MTSVMHVLQPFASQRNTLVTVASELTRVHASAGATSYAVVSEGRDIHVDNAVPVVVDYRRNCPRESFATWQLRADFVAAMLHRPRPFMGKLFDPAVEASCPLRPDVVLVYEGFYAMTSIPLWRKALPGSRIVLYAHNGFSRSYRPFEIRRYLGSADAVACVSSMLKASLIDRLGAAPCAVEVVHNGVDTAKFAPTPRPLRDSLSAFRVLFIGTVDAHKGPDRLLRAVRAAAALTSRPLCVEVVGGSAYGGRTNLSPYEQDLRRLAASLGVDATFTPFQDRSALPDLYRSADLVAVPSLNNEPYALVILEAMACGVPVVASGRGGTKEAGGDAAIYVDPDDTDAFARVITRCADEPDALAERALLSRRWAEQHTWSATLTKLLSVGT